MADIKNTLSSSTESGNAMNKTRITSFRGEYSFLSNFYSSPVHYQGMEFPTAEHAFQAAKTYNYETRKNILQAATPSEAKRLGRTIDLDLNWWNDAKIDIMHEIVWEKFASNSSLKEKLLATGNVVIEESNTWGDRFWGTVNGEGQNALGIILMAVRLELVHPFEPSHIDITFA